MKFGSLFFKWLYFELCRTSAAYTNQKLESHNIWSVKTWAIWFKPSFNSIKGFILFLICISIFTHRSCVYLVYFCKFTMNDRKLWHWNRDSSEFWFCDEYFIETGLTKFFSVNLKITQLYNSFTLWVEYKFLKYILILISAICSFLVFFIL